MAKPDTKVKALLNANGEGLLRGHAKKLIVTDNKMTLTDLWRLSGFNRNDAPGPFPPINQDPELRKITMDDYRSIAEACAQTQKDEGDGDWFYEGGGYSCCCCTACCAVMVLPQD